MGMTAALNLQPLKEVCGKTATKPICGEYADVSLNSKLKEVITATFPPKKIFKSIDVGKMIGGIPGMKAFTNGDKFKLPNMFGGGRRRELRGNQDAAPFPLALAPPIVHSLVPPGMQKVELEGVHSEHSSRKLSADFTLPFKYKTYVLDTSKCEMFIQAMPKKMHFVVNLQLGPKIKAEIEAEFLLAYQLDGVNFEVISRARTKLVAGTAADFNFKDIAGADKLALIDLGGLIDDSLAGTISVVPVGIQFPKD